MSEGTASPAPLELLLAASKQLGGRDEPEARLLRVLSLLSQSVCQQLVLALADAAGGAPTLLTTFADPNHERLAAELAQRQPQLGQQLAAAVPRAVVQRLVSDALLGAYVRDAEQEASVRAFAATEIIVVPLRHGDRPLGVLLAATDRGRRFERDASPLLELVSERIAAFVAARPRWVTPPFRRQEAWAAPSATLRPTAGDRAGRVESERTDASLHALVESGLIGTFEWDERGLIRRANDTFLALLGATRSDLAAQPLAVERVLIPAPQNAGPPAQVREGELLATDGRLIPVLFGSVASSAARGAGVGFVLDVTEQRQRTEFESLLLGVVSHDLRNPLGVVTMASTLLLSQDLTEAQHKLVSRIESAGRKSARLISDLLDFSAARGIGIQLSPELRDLHLLVAQAIDDLRATWPERLIEHRRSGEALSFFDVARVEQIATNLIANALQHGTPAAPVWVETGSEAGALVLSVRNLGRPNPDAVLRRLFTPLHRGDNAGERRGSIGLGLFIVQQLVTSHAGTVEVVSDESHGTRFTVRLPCATHPQPAEARRAAGCSLELS